MRVGEVIGNKYELTELLGESGTGFVYGARRLDTGGKVALKVVFAHLAINDDAIERLFRESKAANDIGSECIAPILDTGRAETGEPYIVRDFLEGCDLTGYLQREGPLSPNQAVPLILQAAEALDLAHQRGMAHWDLKPGNLFVLDDGSGSNQVRILDFGVARFLETVGTEAAQATVSGAAFGVPYYMPLEQARGLEKKDHRVDVYSLGVMLYELLAGVRPFEAESYTRLVLLLSTSDPTSLTSIRTDLSPKLVKVVERAISQDPNARYLSMADLGRALSSLSELDLAAADFRPPTSKVPSELISTRPDLPRPSAGKHDAERGSKTPAPPQPPQKSNQGLWITLGLLVLFLIAGSLVFLMILRSRGRVEETPPAAAVAPAVAAAPDTGLHPDDHGFVDQRGGRDWGDRCFYHLMADRFTAARAACDRGMAIAENNEVRAALHYNLGRISQGEGNVEEARGHYRRSLELNPENPAVQRRLEALVQ